MPETVDDKTAILWHKVVGNKDTDCDEEDDELLVNGYYYVREDGLPLKTGKYYAVVSISESESLPNGAYGVSDLLVIINDAPAP